MSRDEETGPRPEDTGPEDTGPEDTGPEDEDPARRAEERFIDDLISRGEAVPEGQELPPGATHEIVLDDQGRRTVRRRRFKAF